MWGQSLHWCVSPRGVLSVVTQAGLRLLVNGAQVTVKTGISPSLVEVVAGRRDEGRCLVYVLATCQKAGMVVVPRVE